MPDGLSDRRGWGARSSFAAKGLKSRKRKNSEFHGFLLLFISFLRVLRHFAARRIFDQEGASQPPRVRNFLAFPARRTK